MNFLRKIFRKRQPESFDEFKVILKTKKKLSKEQRETITAIVKNGVISGMENSDIGIKIMMSTGISCNGMVLIRTENKITVKF